MPTPREIRTGVKEYDLLRDHYERKGVLAQLRDLQRRTTDSVRSN